MDCISELYSLQPISIVLNAAEIVDAMEGDSESAQPTCKLLQMMKIPFLMILFLMSMTCIVTAISTIY